jgi:hypothetical protein
MRQTDSEVVARVSAKSTLDGRGKAVSSVLLRELGSNTAASASNGMHSWPADCRAHQRGRAVAQRRDVSGGYPRLDNGTVGAVSLCEKDGRLEWTTVLRTAAGTQNALSEN